MSYVSLGRMPGPASVRRNRDPPERYHQEVDRQSVSLLGPQLQRIARFASSAGKVSVTRANQELASYSVSDATGSATLPLWQVVTVTIDVDGHATLTSVQKFVNGNAGTALRFEDGADGAIEWPATEAVTPSPPRPPLPHAGEGEPTPAR